MSLRYLLVANPTARSGRAEALIRDVITRLQRRGCAVDFLATEPEGRTVELVTAAVDDGVADAVVYMGGDGTFAEVAKGLIAAKRKVPMGMLPSGTANDQGKSFGVRSAAQALDDNLDILIAGYARPLDAGHIERLDDSGAVTGSDLFFDSAGFGMHPAILIGRNRDRELVARVPMLGQVYRDQTVYGGAMLREYLRSYTEPSGLHAEVVADGKPLSYHGITDLIVNNTAVYAGMWVPDRLAEPDDGFMELVPMTGRGDQLAKLVRDFMDLPVNPTALEWLGLDCSASHTAAHFEFTLMREGSRGAPLQAVGADARPVPAQIDGEEWLSGNRFRVTVKPRQIDLIVPKDWTPPWRST